MQLNEIIPVAEVEARFPRGLQTKLLDFSDPRRFLGEVPEDVHATCMSVWNRIVQMKLKPVDPQAIGPWAMSGDPRIAREIERIIGVPVITDAAYFSAKFRGEKVATVFLVRTFPNSLHLADVFFRDPAAPLPREQMKRYRDNKGFGLLPTVIERMKAYAEEHSIEYLTLTAAAGDLVPLFEKHGFTVEDNPMGQFCLRTGQCIPMERKLSLIASV